MSFPTYELRKRSNVGWLGDVPEHWEVCSLKRIVRLKSGEGITSDAIDDKGLYPVYGGNGPRGYTSSYTHDGFYVLIGRQGALCGNVNYASGKFWASEHAVVATPSRQVETRWLGELLRAMNLNQYSISAAQPGLAVETLNALQVPLPSGLEQRAIASFLDRETAKIDALVEEQKLLIELLKEKRQAVISHAVTEGLDPNAPMRRSGLVWPYEIPSHWQVLPLARVVRQFVDYRGATPIKTEQGVPLITATQVKNGRIDHSLDPVFISEEEYAERMTRGFPEKGDVILTTEAPLGEAAQIEDEKVAPGQRLILLKVQQSHITNEFLLMHFRSDFGKHQLLSRGTGSTAVGIRADRLKASLVLVPPLEEQVEIVESINNACADIPTTERTVERQIELLEERRAALISSAVTGKIDVRRARIEAEAA
jgi:type I restriction enzyme S subunit